jgi:hypothetical protein
MIENDISEPVSTVEVLKHHPHHAMRQTVGSSMVAIGLRGISKTVKASYPVDRANHHGNGSDKH